MSTTTATIDATAIEAVVSYLPDDTTCSHEMQTTIDEQMDAKGHQLLRAATAREILDAHDDMVDRLVEDLTAHETYDLLTSMFAGDRRFTFTDEFGLRTEVTLAQMCAHDESDSDIVNKIVNALVDEQEDGVVLSNLIASCGLTRIIEHVKADEIVDAIDVSDEHNLFVVDLNKPDAFDLLVGKTIAHMTDEDSDTIVAAQNHPMFDAIRRRHDAEHTGVIASCMDEVCDTYVRTMDTR